MTVGVEAYPPQPVFESDFMGGALDSRLNFARASNAWFRNASGLLTQAASNTPRFDYDPASLSLNGLLIEGQRTNIFLQSGNPGAWAKTNVTITSNAATAPDGTTTAALVTDTTASGFHNVQQNLSGSGTNWWSVYLKQGTIRYAVLAVPANGNVTYSVLVDLQTGAFVSAQTNNSPSGTGYLIQNAGNGWWRVSVSQTATGAIYPNIFLSTSATPVFVTAQPSYTGTGTGTIYVWGGQVETASAFPTSYIPTTTTSATRAGDSLYTASLPWFNPAAGSFALRAAGLGFATANASYLASFSDGTTANNISLFIASNGKAQGGAVVASSAYTSAATAGSPVSLTAFRQGLVYTAGANLAAFNGTLDGAGSWGSAAVPSGLTRLDLGNREDGTLAFNGWLQKFTCWNYALSSAKLQKVTA
ncbi:MAG: hypothetical protein P4M15_13445 [Alphaproteobacteria bacterium]|nr:hypothetical protein [Alphaproteobacteria bacterium]